jgi:hypothetical protein
MNQKKVLRRLLGSECIEPLIQFHGTTESHGVVLVIMPLGADEPKPSSNLRFCSVRWMSLRVSASLCEKWRRAGLCVWSLSAEPIGAGFHTEARRHGAWVLCGG